MYIATFFYGAFLASIVLFLVDGNAFVNVDVVFSIVSGYCKSFSILLSSNTLEYTGFKRNQIESNNN